MFKNLFYLNSIHIDIHLSIHLSTYNLKNQNLNTFVL